MPIQHDNHTNYLERKLVKVINYWNNKITGPSKCSINPQRYHDLKYISPFLNAPISYHNEAFRPRELSSSLSTCQSMINCEIKTKVRNRTVSTKENKSLVYNVQFCWKWGPRTVLEEKFPKPLPLASVLTSGITAPHLTGSGQSPPLAPDPADPTLPTENLGGNSHRHPDTRTFGQTHPCWPLDAALATAGTPGHFPTPMARPPSPWHTPSLPTHLFHTDVQTRTSSAYVFIASQWLILFKSCSKA